MLPRMLISEENGVDAATALTSNGAAAAGIANIALAALLNLSLSMLWSCLNALQLMVYMPLFAIKYPANAFGFIEPLSKIANFDILNEFELQQKLFHWPAVDAYNVNF